MSEACCGHRPYPEGVLAIEKFSRYGEKILREWYTTGALSPENAEYLINVVDLLDAVILENGGKVSDRGRALLSTAVRERAYHLSSSWFATVSVQSWNATLQSMSDSVQRVIDNNIQLGDHETISRAIQYLHKVNDLVRRTYSV